MKVFFKPKEVRKGEVEVLAGFSDFDVFKKMIRGLKRVDLSSRIYKYKELKRGGKK